MAAIVQQATGSGSGANYTVTLGQTPADGNALVALVAARYSGAGLTTISGGGVTWGLGAQSFTNRLAAIWYGLNVAGGGTVITITPVIPIESLAVVAEVSGVPTASANDGTGAANAGTTSPVTSGNLVTTNTDDLLLATGCDTVASLAGSNVAGWTDFTALPAFGDFAFAAAWRIVSATGTYNDTWNDSAPVGWDAVTYALKVGPPGGWSLYRPYTLGSAIDVLTGGLYYYWRRRKQEKPDE